MRRTCTSAMRASAAARVRSSRVRHGESAWASGQHTGTRHLVGPRSRVNVASRPPTRRRRLRWRWRRRWSRRAPGRTFVAALPEDRGARPAASLP